MNAPCNIRRTGPALTVAFLFVVAPIFGEEKKSTVDWYRIEFDGQPVGYESISSAGEGDGTKDATVRRVRDTRIRLKRFGTDVSLSAHLETLETRDGLLLQWSLRRTGADGASIDRSGIWKQDRSGYELQERSSGGKRPQLLMVSAQPRSPVISAWIAEASGFTKTLWTSPVLFPESAGVADIQIDAIGQQSLRLDDGSTVAAQRWDYWPVDAPEMKSSVWADPAGRTLRVEQPLLGQRINFILTDAATALGTESLEALDLQLRSALPVRKSPRKLDDATSQKWKVAVGPVEQVALPEADFQTVEQVSPSELLVTVTRPAIERSRQVLVLSPAMLASVDPSYRMPSRWITSDSPNIQRMAVFTAGSTSAAWDKCQRLVRQVHRQMKFSQFSTTLLAANDVHKTLRGDCTEHAVLLTALLRSEGVPARVAVGFVYRPNPESFVPHMWTEAWIDGTWLPLDSTLGADRVGVSHLKVSDSALGDDVATGTLLFIPLLDFLGRAAVDAVE